MAGEAGSSLQNGKYQIAQELGQGGFGITYRAKLIGLGSTVVIKTPHRFLLAKDAKYADYVKQFVKEGQALERLPNDPHLVGVRDFFEEDGTPYLVMDFIEGETLFEVVKRRGAIPEAEAVEWISTVAQAMMKVHEVGLVHRDLQPANIIIRPDGNPVVIDFSIAHNIQPLSKSTVHSGGHETFAPFEQINKGSRQPNVDVYTLAATLYYIITAKPPESPNKIYFEKAKLTPPKAINPAISDRTNKAILVGMAFHPDERPVSMAAWLKILIGDRKPPLFSRRKLIQYGLLSAGTLVTIVVADRINKVLRSNDRLPLFLPEPPAPSLGSLSLKEQTFKSITLDEFGKNPRATEGRHQYLEEDLGNGVKLTMVFIRGGKFMMGSPEKEDKRYSSEEPVHQVTVPDFLIGQAVINQAQWQAIAQLPPVRRSLTPNPSFYSGNDELPVERVSWNDALEFCDRLTKRTKRPYRLPSEAEWEYACRAGTQTPFHFGATITTEYANYRGTDDDRGQQGVFLGNYGKGPKGIYRGRTVPVKKFEKFSPNAFGLYNMHGNVWEWCMDNWHNNYEGAPIDGSAWLDQSADSSSDRVLRGGSWDFSPQYCRSAIRIFLAPDNRYNSIGFRVICRLRPQDS
jgi:formylglycine-generating enzyme required for sulfatase activity/predicted Ser/Thr protein kinase